MPEIEPRPIGAVPLASVMPRVGYCPRRHRVRSGFRRRQVRRIRRATALRLFEGRADCGGDRGRLSLLIADATSRILKREIEVEVVLPKVLQ